MWLWFRGRWGPKWVPMGKETLRLLLEPMPRATDGERERKMRVNRKGMQVLGRLTWQEYVCLRVANRIAGPQGRVLLLHYWITKSMKGGE